MKKIIIGTLVLLMVISTIAFSADELTVTAQLRHRFEMSNKDFNSGTAFNDVNLLRTRLGVKFAPSDDLFAFVQMQDSRKFGEERGTLADDTLQNGMPDDLDLHQAYFLVKDLFDLPLDVKIGRMEVVYGPQRLIGSVGWHNIGRSFDGFIFKLHFDKFSVDLFNLKEVEASMNGDLGDKNIFGAYADFDLIESHKTQAFLIWQQERPVELLDRYTAGIYAKGNLNGFHHETEFAIQGGAKDNDTTSVSAMMFALNVGYKFKDVGFKPDLTVGVDYLSGDDDPNDNTCKTFDTMYATNHKYYGYMDYFPANMMDLGLMDMHAKVAIKPTAECTMKLAYHMFQANQNYILLDGSESKNFGSEIDLTMKRKYNDHVSFVLGASLFTPGEIFKETMGDKTSTWFYLMTLVNL
ncbi:hypothetical protein CEE37_01455 [candidate division LCP-89 bacterium B3_LCP]|uniref:Alginate export domain-containing protein n=1 Tax=candidate division LCP-89 bacterium B3_LCP TaxID=2012998 RepID=A0A532V595_UNCL8|nr:MAG: hypothetical protein CEE37_01455 [candidate division LCP-89 bacterium B3_LCP]